MAWLTDPEIWVALVTLTVLEVVLGIDNIIFISIMAAKLPMEQQKRGRQTGLILALVSRIALLTTLTWIIRLTAPLFTAFSLDISGRDIILMVGGLFLLGKATFEIHDKLEGEEGGKGPKAAASFVGVVVEIMLLDIVFSLDSVITAVGLARDLPVMIAAVVIAVGIMLYASGPISDFVERHPTIKILALSFLLLIGLSLLLDGLHQHIPKGYVYFAMGFSVFVEALNLRLRKPKAAAPVRLHVAFARETPPRPRRNRGQRQAVNR